MLFHTERVEQVRLLGVFFISSLKAILHVDTMLSDINQRLYIDSQLKAQGLASDSLQIIFHALTLIIIIIKKRLGRYSYLSVGRLLRRSSCP